MSVAYPDVIEIISSVGKADENIQDFILDSELVAFDIEKEKILPFQSLSQRARKHVSEKDLKTKIAVQAFDLLYLNGKPLLKETFEYRR